MNVLEVSGTLLVNNRKTSCGCKSEKNYYFIDITGKQYGRLTALYPLQKRDPKGGVIWHCKCSCGCQKREHESNLTQYLTHFDGTSLDSIKSKKIPTDNTTGVKGVYFVRGKYMAKIVFQQKQYHLGSYNSIEEAAKARQEAEELLFNSVAAHYEKWKAKALNNPQWGIDNPIQILVSKNPLHVTCLPEL